MKRRKLQVPPPAQHDLGPELTFYEFVRYLCQRHPDFAGSVAGILDASVLLTVLSNASDEAVILDAHWQILVDILHEPRDKAKCEMPALAGVTADGKPTTYPFGQSLLGHFAAIENAQSVPETPEAP